MTDADEVDRIVGDWERERPDLDFAPLQVLSRVARLSKHLDRARRAGVRPVRARGIGVRRALGASARRLALPALPQAAAAADARLERHHDEPHRPARRARARHAPDRPQRRPRHPRRDEPGRPHPGRRRDHPARRRRVRAARRASRRRAEAARRRCCASSASGSTEVAGPSTPLRARPRSAPSSLCACILLPHHSRRVVPPPLRALVDRAAESTGLEHMFESR